MWWQLHKTRLEIFAHYLNVSLALDSIEFHLHQIKQDCVVRIEVDCDESWKFSQRSVPSPQSFTVLPIVYEPQFPHSQFKWLNREGWDRIKSEQGVDLLLLLDKHNRYLEMCIGNIFVYVPNEQCWYTPPGDLGILCGTMRQVVIQLLREKGQPLKVQSITRHQDHEVWMSNAVRGLIPVANIDCSTTVVKDLDLWCDQRIDVVNEYSNHLKHLLS